MSETRRQAVPIPSAPSAPTLPPAPPMKPSDEKQVKRISLNQLIEGIVIATLNAKSLVDMRAAEIKRELYERDELLRSMPFYTISISEIEADLRFIITDVESSDKDTRIIVYTDFEKLSSVEPESISRIKFKITGKPITEYRVGESRVFHE